MILSQLQLWTSSYRCVPDPEDLQEPPTLPTDGDILEDLPVRMRQEESLLLIRGYIIMKDFRQRTLNLIKKTSNKQQCPHLYKNEPENGGKHTPLIKGGHPQFKSATPQYCGQPN
jgi:hypothetical protein